MAERIVGVMKKALRKYVLTQGVSAWPSKLPTIEFRYRTTPQRATGFSPYFLLYGRHPTCPPHAQAILDGNTFDVENEEVMLQLITTRAAVLRETMPLAFERAAIRKIGNFDTKTDFHKTVSHRTISIEIDACKTTTYDTCCNTWYVYLIFARALPSTDSDGGCSNQHLVTSANIVQHLILYPF